MQTPKAKRPDFILTIPIVILLGLGLVMVYSASGAQSLEIYGDSNAIFIKQLIAMTLGLIGMVIGLSIPHQLYRKKLILLLMLGTVGFLLVGVYWQDPIKGAHRWYQLGPLGFQPSDLAKIVLIMYVAAVVSGFDKHANPWRMRLIFLVPVLAVAGALILFQPDFGATMIVLGIAGVMLFIAGLPLRMMALGGILVLPMMVGLLLTQSYRVERLRNFFASDQEHYQTVQAKMAVGTGGLMGVGLGKGTSKLHYLPEPHTDFIFATLCEEFGFVGALTVLICYLFFLLRGLVVLHRAPDPFSRYLGSGLLMLITLQAFLNMSVALDLFPNKGLTLPFVSAGGTSLMLTLTIFGILLNISRYQVMSNRVAA